MPLCDYYDLLNFELHGDCTLYVYTSVVVCCYYLPITRSLSIPLREFLSLSLRRRFPLTKEPLLFPRVLNRSCHFLTEGHYRSNISALTRITVVLLLSPYLKREVVLVIKIYRYSILSQNNSSLLTRFCVYCSHAPSFASVRTDKHYLSDGFGRTFMESSSLPFLRESHISVLLV